MDNITIEIDEELKEQMEKLCRELETTVEEVFVKFMEYVVKNKKMPFENERFTTFAEYMNDESKVSKEERLLIEKEVADIVKDIK